MEGKSVKTRGLELSYTDAELPKIEENHDGRDIWTCAGISLGGIGGISTDETRAPTVPTAAADADADDATGTVSSEWKSGGGKGNGGDDGGARDGAGAIRRIR